MNMWNWWDELMNKTRRQGYEDGMAGIYRPPYKIINGIIDPQDQAANEQYQEGWNQGNNEKRMIPL